MSNASVAVRTAMDRCAQLVLLPLRNFQPVQLVVLLCLNLAWLTTFYSRTVQMCSLLLGCVAVHSVRCMRPVVTYIAWSLCSLVTSVRPSNTAELVEMPFGMWTHFSPRNCILWVSRPQYGKWHLWGVIRGYADACPRATVDIFNLIHEKAPVMQPLATSAVALVYFHCTCMRHEKFRKKFLGLNRYPHVSRPTLIRDAVKFNLIFLFPPFANQ